VSEPGLVCVTPLSSSAINPVPKATNAPLPPRDCAYSYATIGCCVAQAIDHATRIRAVLSSCCAFPWRTSTKISCRRLAEKQRFGLLIWGRAKLPSLADLECLSKILCKGKAYHCSDRGLRGSIVCSGPSLRPPPLTHVAMNGCRCLSILKARRCVRHW
jgi:hypothetical protein